MTEPLEQPQSEFKTLMDQVVAVLHQRLAQPHAFGEEELRRLVEMPVKLRMLALRRQTERCVELVQTMQDALWAFHKEGQPLDEQQAQLFEAGAAALADALRFLATHLEAPALDNVRTAQASFKDDSENLGELRNN
jgi:hypothetical protein